MMSDNNFENLQEEINNLKTELSIRESKFSEKRAQFKELYIKKEQELLKSKTIHETLLNELNAVKNELIDVQSAAALSELIRKEDLDSMKQTYNEELSLINGIMKENIDSINKTKEELEQKIMKLELEKSDLSRKLEDKNNELIISNDNVLVKIAQRLKLNTHDIFKGFHENSDENVDADLSKAQNDAEILKSVVEPYEEDVKMLKSKIRDAYAKIDHLEASALLSNATTIEELQKEIAELKNKLTLEIENSNFLKQTLTQINEKYFDAENKLLRSEKLMTESQKSQTKYLVESLKNVEDHVNSVIMRSNITSNKFNLKKSLSGNDIKHYDDDDEYYKDLPSNIARRNTDVQSLNEFNDRPSFGELPVPVQMSDRVISENEWSRLQLELASLKTRKSGHCELCKNYEDQLQSIQTQYKDKERLVNELLMENKDNLRVIDRLQETSNKLANHINEEISSQELSITGLSEKIGTLNEFCERLRSAYERFRNVTDQELKHINNERREMKLKMEKIELAYDNLLCKRMKVAAEMEAEPIELPTDMESAQFVLLKLKEDLIQCRATNEHLTESLQGVEIFNKEKEEAEKNERDAIMNEFSSEKKDLETQVEKLQLELNKRKVLSKSTELLEETIVTLKNDLETVQKSLSNSEQENKLTKSKMQALQQELENSESVQQDFVRLSQTLQIQLEKIRQEEKELRWQFKDDILNCNDCLNDLSTSGDRKKYHCKHCGRIFCKICLVEIAIGSNLKKANVCRVCHTLLVKEAVPYFSTSKS